MRGNPKVFLCLPRGKTNNISFAVLYCEQVQLIHWNKKLYKNIGEAMGGENGLCIIGLLYQVRLRFVETSVRFKVRSKSA